MGIEKMVAILCPDHLVLSARNFPVFTELLREISAYYKTLISFMMGFPCSVKYENKIVGFESKFADSVKF